MNRPTLAFVMSPALTPDLISPAQHARFAELCAVQDAEPLQNLRDERARQLLPVVEILVTGWGCPPIDAEALAAAPRLRLILHAGSSVKPIATPSVWRRDIAVVSAAAANAIPVAEFTLATILLANKRAFTVRERYRTERQAWRLPWTAPGESGNFAAVVGIVGASRIGRHVCELLRPLTLHVVIADPYLSAAEARSLSAELLSLDALLAQSNVVSLHAPLLPTTAGMIGRRELALMRDGATLVNTARGGLIDMPALEAELAASRLNAVLDVTEPEPLPPTSPLFDLSNVFLTTHIAGAAGAETQRMTTLLIDELVRFLHGEPLQHRITKTMLERLG